MKRVVVVLAFAALLAGCSYLQAPNQSGSPGGMGAGVEMGRGTTGVSTGADAGAGADITGSDAAPR